jgi:hypothetical protein
MKNHQISCVRLQCSLNEQGKMSSVLHEGNVLDEEVVFYRRSKSKAASPLSLIKAALGVRSLAKCQPWNTNS